MSTVERIKMIKAMEFICRTVNDEHIADCWLIDGVADGDIEPGDLSVNPDDADNLEFYLRDENFADLMDTFLYVMRRAHKTGGLYCDGVTSKAC